MGNNLTGTIGVCVTVAIMLIVGIMVFGSIYDSMPTDVTQSVTAETFTTGVWGQYVQLDHTNIVNNSESVYNSTTTFTKAGNWTLNATDGTIATVVNSSILNSTAYSISYTWTGISEMATDVIPTIGSAFTLASIIVIVMAAGAILLVLSKFGQR